MALETSPASAAETAFMIAVVVKMLVERPRHAATVKGFSKYAALTTVPCRLSLLLGDVKSLVETDSPVWAIASIAWAFKRSIRVYRAPMAVLVKAKSGRLENIGSRMGA